MIKVTEQKKEFRSLSSVVAERQSQKFTKQDMRNQITNIIKLHQKAIKEKKCLEEYTIRLYKKVVNDPTKIHYPSWWKGAKPYAEIIKELPQPKEGENPHDFIKRTSGEVKTVKEEVQQIELDLEIRGMYQDK